MTTIISFLTLIITGVYAYLTYRIVQASKEQTESVFRPYIVITHRLSSETLIRLYIKNTGKTNACNLRLQIDRDFRQLDRKGEEQNIAKNFAFNNVIETFPPGSELKFALMPTVALYSDTSEKYPQPFIFTITATYSYADKTVTEKTTIDLRPYKNTSLPDYSVEDKLEALTKEISEIKEIIKGRFAG
jgi:hypothetical protein